VSGYRTSSYEPDTSLGARGAPMRPYNGVQKFGLAVLLVGMALDLAYLAGRMGWIRPLLGNPMLAIAFILPGILLVNSRRQPVPDLAPELAPARRRWLMIISLICLAVLGLATAIQFTGA
jgi:hypothetical protein